MKNTDPSFQNTIAGLEDASTGVDIRNALVNCITVLYNSHKQNMKEHKDWLKCHTEPLCGWKVKGANNG